MSRRYIKRATILAIYLALLGGDVALSHWDDLFGREQCDLVKARSWYQRVVTVGYRKPKPHFVRVVTVRPPEDPCEYRVLLADLVRRIGDLQPTMIVLDYSFSPHKCDEATRKLQDSIGAVARHSPVVFGIRSSTLQEEEDRDKSELASLQQMGFGPDDQVLWPSDIKADGHQIVTGLYRLDCDTRRVPINWSAFEKTDGQWVHRSSRVPTIAFAAASLYDSTIENQALLKGTENPFTSFISEGLFHPIESSEVLSGSFDVRQLQRKIVLIGDGLKDMHESVVGRVPGVVLQANYIESLLDERYFTGQGPLAGTVTALICIAIIAAIFDKTSTAHRGLFRSGFFLLLLMFVSYVALVHFATLFTFWVPGLLAIGPAYLAKWHSLRSAGGNNAIRIKSVKTTNEREDLVASRPASNYQHR